jgi:predicted PurR-regulated permease PerM
MGLSVLIALLAGTELAGVVGALVAVPSAALVAVIMDEYLVQQDADAKSKVVAADATSA